MSGLDELGRDLGTMSATIVRRVKTVVEQSADAIKKDARQFSRGISHAPRYPRSITTTVYARPTGIVAEIGPENTAVNQGFLGRTLELGNATTPPIAHMGPALARETPNFLEGLVDATNVPL